MFGIVPFNRRNPMARNDLQDWFGLDVNRLFDHFMNDSMFPDFMRNGNEMKVDIKENDKEYILEAELPGVKKENINLEVYDDRLTISAEHKEETNEEGADYIRRERRYGSMSRSFYIDNVNPDGVSAKFENGMLTVILPKKNYGRSNRHRIQIQ